MKNLRDEKLTGAENQVKDTTHNNEGKLFTQDELDKIISKRLERDRVKIESEFKAKIEEEIKLARMTEEERQKVLFEKELKKYEEEKALFEKEKLIAHAQKELIKNNLPESMAKFLTGKTQDETNANIAEFIEINIRPTVDNVVKTKLMESEYTPPGKRYFSVDEDNTEDAFLKAFKC